nr:uncharacterized protein LOC125420995 [Ziziphus jujuba var. spinosa]
MQKFDELKTQSQLLEDPRQTLARFKSGLGSNIRRELLQQPIYSLEQAFQVSLDLEEYLGSLKRPNTMLNRNTRIVANQPSKQPMKAKASVSNTSDLREELPSDLPLMCNIQHAIDLVPGAQLPNLLVCHMNSSEHAELKRQMDELLSKGFIRESLKNQFLWTNTAVKAFEEVKKRLTEAPVFRLPNFSKVFKVACDASNVGFGGIISQEGHPIAFFSEKLNEANQKYSNYDKEFYTMVQALQYWHHYLISKQFVLFSYHEALKYLNSQKKMNYQHGKWISFLQEYSFLIKHKSGAENKVVDALSRVVYLLTSMAIQVVGYESLKRDYTSCKDFSLIHATLASGQLGEYPSFLLHDDYLFKGTKLCLPNTSLREQVIWELHGGGATDNFGRDKTIAMVEDQFYW